MGKSQSIKDLEKVSEKFSAFMEKMKQEMETNSVKYLNEYNLKIDSFYAGKGHDYIQIAGREHFDYQFETEFSMKNISQIVEKTSAEVFLSLDKYEEGLRNALVIYEEMATKMAVHFLISAMVSLTMKQTAGYRYNIQQVPVGPGITLHLLIVEMCYDGETFLSKKKIIQNFICYRVYFSKELAKVEAEVEYLQECLNEMKSNSEVIKVMRKERINLFMNKSFIEEPQDGPLHMHLNNLGSMIAQLQMGMKKLMIVL